MGIWEGQTIADIEKQFPEEVHLFWNEPHLFSQHQAKILRPFMKRVIEGMRLLLEKHKGQNILIVSHAAAENYL